MFNIKEDSNSFSLGVQCSFVSVSLVCWLGVMLMMVTVSVIRRLGY
jgi:hypothetical protein